MQHLILSPILLLSLVIPTLLGYAVSQNTQQINEKNSFSETEAEERSKIQGTWSVSALPDVKQVQDDTVPVVINRVEVFIGGSKKYAGMLKVTGGVLNNRSPRPLSGVEIKWRITKKNDPDADALEGAISPIAATIPANGRQHLDFPVFNFTTVAQPLLRPEFTYAEFVVTLRVSKAVFADGTIWEEGSAAFVKASSRRTPQGIVCVDESRCQALADYPFERCESDETTTNARCNIGPCTEFGCGCGTDVGFGRACPTPEPPARDCSDTGILPIDGRSCHSPILIDVAGDGFKLTDAAHGVNFDLDRKGGPERLAWTEANSDDAWLVFDHGRDGKIDGEDVFGNYTAQPTDVPLSKRNGFLALAPFDISPNGGNDNGVIDAGDSVFVLLRLWQDVNHNGIAEPGELHTLPSLGVESLSFNYKESKKGDQYGNAFKYRAKVYGAKHSDTGRWAYDVFLRKSP